MQLSIILLILLILYIVLTSESKFEALKIILSAGAIALFIRTFFFQPFTIPSGSMIPTLLIGDFIFVSQYKYGYSKHSLPFSIPLIKGRILAKKPERGDVVVFKTPNDNRTDYVKTLVGLPGDKVQVKNGTLFINNNLVYRDSILNSSIKVHNDNLNDFDYVEIFPNGKKHFIRELKGNDAPGDNTIVYTVPENNFFLMGDNRDNSIDSRILNYVGFVPFENLVGRAEIIFFSIDKKNYGLKKFWKWRIRFDRIGKVPNKKVNIYYES
ncbi:MAG: Signal peptidase I [Alphaproteobacteria bacterium MarineAlpha6_Bin4]|nr:MAG: Signal peptidase I [Alphaproteobacteria bacterium MarineAlpha6_Bin3]PPR37123.1 MAG: Signal peptidase I [Alphaproteobacteria bacterium MarineAlpha6_Bin4]|tara:strand:- start:4242 stop:5045 length:804 start_codon:yes stop_codon:yes gene_type:complete